MGETPDRGELIARAERYQQELAELQKKCECFTKQRDLALQQLEDSKTVLATYKEMVMNLQGQVTAFKYCINPQGEE